MMYYEATAEDLNLKKYFSYSVFFHIALTAALLAGVWFQRTGESWGGVGGGDTGVKVNLVSSAAAGIPMPPNITPTESEAVDITKGLYKEEPPKPPEPKTDATKIPKFDKEKPLPPSKPSKVFE
ncbi:MAG: hypothetical protein WBW49_14605, partial [Candidatus Acidiferrum sp.]